MRRRHSHTQAKDYRRCVPPQAGAGQTITLGRCQGEALERTHLRMSGTQALFTAIARAIVVVGLSFRVCPID